MESNTWITTYTGKKFYPLEPRPEDIDILDIAHQLSLVCRFNGCCRVHYSVAEHSVRGLPLVPKRDRLAFLLHDSPEAYMTDLGRPIKSVIPTYKTLENQLLIQIYLKFGVRGYNKEEIKKADNILLATEGRDLMVNTDDWYLPEPPMVYKIEPWTQLKAREVFLYEFEKLYHNQDGTNRL